MYHLVILFISIFVFTLLYVVLTAPIRKNKKKTKQLRKYESITLGMSEADMISVMGKGYNKSLLKDNRTKYEWRINGVNVRASRKGYQSSVYTGVSKVDIYCKDGLVEEVRPFNTN